MARTRDTTKKLFPATPDDEEADRLLNGYGSAPMHKPVLASKGEAEIFAVGRVSGKMRFSRTKTGKVLIFQTAQMNPTPVYKFRARETEEWRVYGNEDISEVVKHVLPGMMVAVTAWRRTVVKFITRSVRQYSQMNIVKTIDILDEAPDYDAALRKEVALYDGSQCDERK